jgi:site-specific DNA-cytosine methylase
MTPTHQFHDDDGYMMLGTRRQQVRMAGNAVTPPAARDLIAAVAASLTRNKAQR